MGLKTLIAAVLLIRHWVTHASPIPNNALPLAIDGGDFDIDSTASTSTSTLPAFPITVTTTSTTVPVTVTADPAASITLLSTILASTPLTTSLTTSIDPFHGPGFHRFNHTRASHFADATATSLLSTLESSKTVAFTIPFATAVATLIPVHLSSPVHPAGYHHINETYAPHYENVVASGVAVSEEVTASLTARAEAAMETGWAAGGVGPVVGVDVKAPEIEVPTLIGAVTVPDMPVDGSEVEVPTLIGDVEVAPAKSWTARAIEPVKALRCSRQRCRRFLVMSHPCDGGEEPKM